MTPLVAVIIPVYNKGDTVGRTIASVRAQTLTDIEIIIVDDGSTDNSQEEVYRAVRDMSDIDGDGMAAVDGRCKYVYQENRGVAHARNNGVLEHSTAPFVVCLDSDDAIEPGYLQLLANELRKERSLGIVYTSLRFILPDGKTGVSNWPGVFDVDKQFAGQNQIPTSAMTRRKVWERLRGQRQRFAPLGAGAEDGDFWLRAVSYGFGAKFVHPKKDCYFVYSWQSGIVSGDPNYREVDYKAWSTWTKHYHLMPTASIAKPRLFSHPARQYDEPTVSVIIPVGPNHVQYLVNCLDSLEAQTYKKWEAIVVFDIGQEEFNELYSSGELRRVSDGWPFCRWASTGGEHEVRDYADILAIMEVQQGPEPAGQPDSKRASMLASMLPAPTPQGAGVARNIGIKLAAGPLLMFLDADDWLVPTALGEMVKEFKNTGKIVYTDHTAIATIKQEDLGLVDGEVVAYNERKGEAYINQRIEDYHCEWALEQPWTDGRAPYIICNVSSLVPKKWVVELGGFNTDINSWEDVLLFWQLAWAGRCFTRIPKPLLVYRYATGSRRELGRKNAKVLLEYLSELSERTVKMGCGCGQKNTSGVIYDATSGGEEMVQLNLSRGGTLQVNDSDVVLAEFNPPDLGGKMRFGSHQFTGGMIRYGHFAGGEIFYVHKLDIEADAAIAQAQGRAPAYTPVQSPEVVVEASVDEVMELAVPVEVSEPAAWGWDESPQFLSPVPADPEDYFPEPDPIPDVVPIGTTLDDLNVDLKNVHKYIAIFKSNVPPLITPEELIMFDQQNQDTDGIQGIKGIGPKVSEAFLSASRKALNL
jgi:glycosyltransferase involved in cell wall biosynthesis